VEVPTQLTYEQKELLRKFDATGGQMSNPITSQYFDKVKNLFG
jgi:DnaJ-class molecular chaperone